MERIEHLVDTFRVEHPELDTDVLLEFAQHVQRVMRDDIREQARADNANIKVSMQVNGSTFSANGPSWMVEELLVRWETAMDLRRKNITPGFNRLKLISGR